MRHDKPRINNDLRLGAKEFGAWVNEYNASGIDAAYPPPQLAAASLKVSDPLGFVDGCNKYPVLHVDAARGYNAGITGAEMR